MTENTIRVVIPLTVRRKNGRPKILPPIDHMPTEAQVQDAHVLKAIAKAWSWRRKLENGAASTIADIAKTENVSDRYVSRMMQLAYLSPDVLEYLLIKRISSPFCLKGLTLLAKRSWGEQLNYFLETEGAR